MTRDRHQPDLTGVPAGIATRAAAYILDIVIAFALYTLGTFLLAFAWAIVVAREITWPEITTSVVSIGFLVFWVIYLGYWWATAGKSPGKMITGIRVVHRSGAPVGRVRAGLRALLYLIPPPVVSWPFVLLRRDRQGFHDFCTGTRVVYDWGERPVELRGRSSRVNKPVRIVVPN